MIVHLLIELHVFGLIKGVNLLQCYRNNMGLVGGC